MDGNAVLDFDDPIGISKPRTAEKRAGTDRQAGPEGLPHATPAGESPDPAPAKPKRGVGRLILMALVIAGLAAGGLWVRDWWTVGRFMVSTDDAYVKADITGLSAEISGTVIEVLARNDMPVEQGQPIARLDARDLALAVDRARAALDGAQAASTRLEAQIVAARAGVRQAQAGLRAAEAVLTNADRNHTRIEHLANRSVAAEARLDDATAALEQARAGREQSLAAIETAKAQLAVLEAQRAELSAATAQARAALGTAELNLSRATVTAPVAGILSGFHLAQGNMISAGQRIASIVPADRLYVEANYKETQMPGIVPGAEVEIAFDAIPDRTFSGRVESVSAATGSEFSVLPSQNATGNFTKIVQRVPVRIAIPAEALETGQVRAGLSVEVSADSRAQPAAGHRIGG